jgi:hypothetical protein
MSRSGSAQAPGQLRQNQVSRSTQPISQMGMLVPYMSHTTEGTSSPSQALQYPVSETNGFRVPTAPMQPPTQLDPDSWLIPKSTNGMYSSSAAPSLQSSIRQTGPISNWNEVSRQGYGAFAPTHTEQEWDGVVKSVSPELASRPALQNLPTASTTPPRAPRTMNNRKRKSVTRPTPAQYDGAIDLTSDTELEEERQNLLSSFKGSTTTRKQPQLLAASASGVPTAPMQRCPVVIQDLEEDAGKTNNPYARYR